MLVAVQECCQSRITLLTVSHFCMVSHDNGRYTGPGHLTYTCEFECRFDRDLVAVSIQSSTVDVARDADTISPARTSRPV